MNDRDEVQLTRDVTGILIPDGTPYPLYEGNPVTIMQTLGGAYTVFTDVGYMVRIGAEDADALGKTPMPPAPEIAEASDEPASVEKATWALLHTCYDPEIPIDIVELGLIYGCKVTPVPSGKNRVDIQMTLTAPGCGMGPVIQSDVERKVRSLSGVEIVDVEIVLDPPWTQDLMSDEARLELGLF